MFAGRRAATPCLDGCAALFAVPTDHAELDTHTSEAQGNRPRDTKHDNSYVISHMHYVKSTS